MTRPGVLEENYFYEYEIGQWTFGTIQAVREKATGLKRICKTVSKLSFLDLGNVRTEVQQLQKLRHPNICAIVECVEDDACFYLIVEHSDGGEVAELLERMDERAWLDEKTIAVYIQQLLVAIAHCHSARIYHRDLRAGCLGLTSKLPDASVKVMDFGLAAIFDPSNQIVRQNPAVHVAPELLSGREAPLTWQCDMWSVGAITFSLLVNKSPYKVNDIDGARNSSWELGNAMRGPLRFFQDDGWGERSVHSRNFIRELLCAPDSRLTAAQALQHPWLRKFAPIGTPRWAGTPGQATQGADEVHARLLCYMVALLLVPSLVSPQDFEQLRAMFLSKDTDHDGFLARGVVGTALRNWGMPDDAIAKALGAADVFKSGVFDLCGLLVAHLLAVHFPKADGPSLISLLQIKFFESYGDQGSSMNVILIPEVNRRIKTNTMRQVEAYASVRYATILSAFPLDRPVDKRAFLGLLAEAHGAGTPLDAIADEEEPTDEFSDGDLDGQEWGSRFQFGSFPLCGQCTAGRRESSPYSMRIG